MPTSVTSTSSKSTASSSSRSILCRSMRAPNSKDSWVCQCTSFESSKTLSRSHRSRSLSSSQWSHWTKSLSATCWSKLTKMTLRILFTTFKNSMPRLFPPWSTALKRTKKSWQRLKLRQMNIIAKLSSSAICWEKRWRRPDDSQWKTRVANRLTLTRLQWLSTSALSQI